MRPILFVKIVASALVAVTAIPSLAAECKELPNWQSLQNIIRSVVPASGTPSGGLGFPMWITLVDGSGEVCAVATSLVGGSVTSNIWLGSRIISAQKANTANSFSNERLSLSTANLYSAVQPGGSLFGLQESNPVNAEIAYRGEASKFGTWNDPITGHRIGGLNVFGGGLTLYRGGVKVGAIGVSGDTSCTDHVVAYKARAALGLNNAPGPLDKMFQDISPPVGSAGISASGFGHPTCLNNPTAQNSGGSIVH